MKKLELHWKIIIGMIAGVGIGFLAVATGQQQLVANWIKPLGTIFINLLKIINIH